jgi:hypothetical protein
MSVPARPYFLHDKPPSLAARSAKISNCHTEGVQALRANTNGDKNVAAPCASAMGRSVRKANHFPSLTSRCARFFQPYRPSLE